MAAGTQKSNSDLDLGCRVLGFGFWVMSLGFGVQVLGLGSWV